MSFGLPHEANRVKYPPVLHVGMEQHVPMNVVNHFRRNRDDYSQIESRLSDVREKVETSDMDTAVRMLQVSHSFAVLSVQTPVDVHERAFTNLWQNVGVTDSYDDIAEAINECNYYKNKARYILDSFQRKEDWKEVVELLRAGEIDKAHKMILDEFLGVGTVKAPFTLAMLGYTEKMCIDTNVANVVGLEEKPNTVVVDKYESICESVREMFPLLQEIADPFIFQWVVFDYKRGNISHHETFFNVVGV